MKRAVLLAAALLFPAAALAQTITPPPPSVAAVIAAVQAGIPTPCPAAPAADTLHGSPSTQSCYIDNTATRPTVVQAAKTTTDASAHFSVTWARMFTSATPYAHAEPIDASTNPIECRIATATATTVTGDCYQSVKSSTSGIVGLTGALVTSTLVSTGANVDVRIIARETTQ